ncbi:MAG: nitrilase-related carbon-nitrogen hydrolase [Actinomycetaceae bacterium]|nr:nitrilase-related carbon-nitrogen hydrolase [Actinomycetaceae bacterium]
MRIALAQICSSQSMIENLDAVGTTMIQAKRAGAKCIIFPEATLASFQSRLSQVAQSPNGSWANHMATFASQLGITNMTGIFEQTNESNDNRLHNTYLIARPHEPLIRYRKRHLFDAGGYQESKHFRPGNTPVHVELGEGLTASIHICYDIRFPRDFLQAAENGTNVHIVGASWNNFKGGVDQWLTLTRARAMDTGSWVIGVGQARNPKISERGPFGCGHSVVIAPDGSIVAQADEDPDVLYVDIDTKTVNQQRERYPLLAHQ